ncbi:TPA: ead/Ea22-like family protein [Salmonella enterica subsp. enterica serovar Enteritidis]
MSAITELVQRMKLAASLATQGEWSYARSGFNSIVQAPVALLRGGAARVVLCKLFRSEWRSELNTAHDAAFIALANPTNVMALVGELEARDKQIAELVADRLNLLRTMGVYVHAYEEAKSHIAELEFRPVKLPDSFYLDGDIELPLVMNEYQVIEALVAAGCKPVAVCPRCKRELDLSVKHDGAHYCHLETAFPAQ